MTIEKNKSYEEVKKRFEERMARHEAARRYEEAKKRFEARTGKELENGDQ